MSKTKELFGYALKFEWSNNGLWWFINSKDGVKHTPILGIHLIEKEEMKAVAIIFLKISIVIAKL